MENSRSPLAIFNPPFSIRFGKMPRGVTAACRALTPTVLVQIQARQPALVDGEKLMVDRRARFQSINN